METPYTQATTMHTPEEPSTAPLTLRGLADGRHERRVFASWRLVLMSQDVTATEVDESMLQGEVHESDTESVMTVPEDGFDDDLAEEDGVRSEGEPQVFE